MIPSQSEVNRLVLATAILGGDAGSGFDAVGRMVEGGGKLLSLPTLNASREGDVEVFNQLKELGFSPKYNTEKYAFLYECPAPDGWTIEGTDHWLYKRLCDPQGQARFELMIHFQDRDSWIRSLPKYIAGTWQKSYMGGEPEHACVRDSNGKLVWLGKVHQAGQKERTGAEVLAEALKGYEGDDLFKAQVTFPEWEYDPSVLKDYRVYTEYYNSADSHYASDQGSTSFKEVDDVTAIAIVEKKHKSNRFGYLIRTVLYGPEGKEIFSCDDRDTVLKRRGYNFGYDDVRNAFFNGCFENGPPAKHRAKKKA